MVDWTDIPDRNRGQKRPRYSANVAPIRPGQDDARSEMVEMVQALTRVPDLPEEVEVAQLEVECRELSWLH